MTSPILKAVKETCVAACQRYQSTGDEHLLDVRSGFEDVAVGYDDVCHLSDLDRPQLIPEAEYLGRVDRDGPECVLF